MFDSTPEAVLAMADDFGYLLWRDAQLIVREHSLRFNDAVAELGDSVTDAEQLLCWLGY